MQILYSLKLEIAKRKILTLILATLILLISGCSDRHFVQPRYDAYHGAQRDVRYKQHDKEEKEKMQSSKQCKRYDNRTGKCIETSWCEPHKKQYND